ncbi:hypothetical protein DERP_004135 [Dermatophagoides pteronyssinus]|uniref:Transmembrane protein n=1 Tax=Dermatophagoides pteronyssinus TaxID=6956 RepID=A0ABQ8J8B0_DERPT|nr:hypothetical protein DERP_004135 [Dermatophagoides pteronyssinus]
MITNERCPNKQPNLPSIERLLLPLPLTVTNCKLIGKIDSRFQEKINQQYLQHHRHHRFVHHRLLLIALVRLLLLLLFNGCCCCGYCIFVVRCFLLLSPKSAKPFIFNVSAVFNNEFN